MELHIPTFCALFAKGHRGIGVQGGYMVAFAGFWNGALTFNPQTFMGDTPRRFNSTKGKPKWIAKKQKKGLQRRVPGGPPSNPDKTPTIWMTSLTHFEPVNDSERQMGQTQAV